MDFWTRLLQILDLRMDTPGLYGWFHLLWLGITAGTAVVLCVFGRKWSHKTVCNILLGTAIAVMALEVYKQINYTFGDGSSAPSYQWYAFPWQFCSTPMYVGLLAGICRKGKLHDALCAYLATFGMFAGLAVMLYPGDVFIETVGINIQTMVCHGSMVAIGIYLFGSGHVQLAHKTVLKAVPVFAVAVGVAMALNALAYNAGIADFNMFYISPHCDPHLPVYSLVQEKVPYPASLVIYILGFTVAAYAVLLLVMLLGGKCLVRKDVVARKAHHKAISKGL